MKSKVKKILYGRVISNKMDKTIVVLVKRYFKHPLYKKIINCNNKYYVHDSLNKSKIGDYVKFQEHKPISKTKFWIIK